MYVYVYIGPNLGLSLDALVPAPVNTEEHGALQDNVLPSRLLGAARMCAVQVDIYLYIFIWRERERDLDVNTYIDI